MRDIVILGSTGSIGTQALEVIEANPELFRVIGLSAGSSNHQLLAEQAKKFRTPVIGTSAEQFQAPLPDGTSLICGPRSAAEIASIPADIVLNGITGSIGLAPTLAALSAGNKVALANKESLVAGGDLVMKFGQDRLIPVDSEHSALFQALLSGKRSEVKKLILTASGGAFRDREDLTHVTLADALAHPTWNMGPVVTINSATLVNKGLEIIEAHYLFDIPYSQIEAVIHPQSVIHSLVEFHDGSTLAQASPPNMKGPIAYALGYPERIARATKPIDWSTSHKWDFRPIDNKRFPAINLARRVGEIGGGAPAIYNAANEVAVEAFMAGKLKFTSILTVVSKTLDALDDHLQTQLRDLSDVSGIEQNARVVANSMIEKIEKIEKEES
jgi:1-deoxy-D-xylulose-5-phosphate reductoisomerase